MDAFIALGLDIGAQLKGARDFMVFGHRLKCVELCPYCQPAPAAPSSLPNEAPSPS